MNDELDGDEVMLGIVSFFFAIWTLGRWLMNLRLAWRFRTRHFTRGLVLTVPPVCVSFIAFVVNRWADAEVRGNDTYISMLVLLGMAWLAGVTRLFGWIGINLRDDGLERNNFAAASAWAGALIGVTFCYAGANIGVGPSLWNNVFSAALASFTLLLVWLVLELGCRISSSITLERDGASGLRSGSFLATAGLVLGRAVAGDWHSAVETISDFVRDGWPVLVLAFVAFVMERALRPTARRISPSPITHGVIPAATFLLLALGWLLHLGFWEGRK